MLLLSIALEALPYCTGIPYLESKAMDAELQVKELVGADVIQETSGHNSRMVKMCGNCNEDPDVSSNDEPSRQSAPETSHRGSPHGPEYEPIAIIGMGTQTKQ